jgi:hypothetical protein
LRLNSIKIKRKKKVFFFVSILTAACIYVLESEIQYQCCIEDEASISLSPKSLFNNIFVWIINEEKKKRGPQTQCQRTYAQLFFLRLFNTLKLIYHFLPLSPPFLLLYSCGLIYKTKINPHTHKKLVTSKI